MVCMMHLLKEWLGRQDAAAIGFMWKGREYLMEGQRNGREDMRGGGDGSLVLLLLAGPTFLIPWTARGGISAAAGTAAGLNQVPERQTWTEEGNRDQKSKHD